MLADTLGRPLRFIITAGQVGDVTQAQALLVGQNGAAVIADKAYDSNTLRALSLRWVQKLPYVAIPFAPYHIRTYKLRNRIERCFNRLKHFRRFVTRYDRRTIHFLGFVHLA